MKKIAENLQSKIREHPGSSYKVLIVLKEGNSGDQLNIDNYNKVMDNILSAELKGAKIQHIADMEIVESIELDEEMEIT